MKTVTLCIPKNKRNEKKEKQQKKKRKENLMRVAIMYSRATTNNYCIIANYIAYLNTHCKMKKTNNNNEQEEQQTKLKPILYT